jgi:predicted ATPase
MYRSGMAAPGAPYLERISVLAERIEDFGAFPYSLPFVRGFSLAFTNSVTFLVGENGSGKSTLIEGLAEVCGLPVSGGSKNELAERHGPDARSALGSVLRPSFRRKPRDGYFFRAELQALFASLLEERRDDPDFRGDPFAAYGGRSLHARSHGEAFLAVILGRMRAGIFIMDEPESALSPQRQLTLLVRMAELAAAGQTQFIIATHSPILLTFPGGEIVSLDRTPPAPVALADTSHYQITRGILESPERYWKHLVGSAASGGDEE